VYSNQFYFEYAINASHFNVFDFMKIINYIIYLLQLFK